MVLTRSQMKKEENETALAKQQSLEERSQKAFAPQQLEHDIQGAAISQQDIFQQNVIQQGVVQQDLAQKDIFDEVSVKLDAEQSKTVGALPIRERKIVSDNVEADVPVSKSSVRVKDRKASVTGSKRYVPSVKKTQKKNMPATIRTKIDGESFKIPVNPEDEEDFIPETGSVINPQKIYGLRTRVKKSSNKKRRTATTSSRLTKPSTVQSSKKTRAGDIVKTRQKDAKEKKLVFTLTLGGKKFARLVKKIKKSKKILLKRVKTPKAFFTNKYRFKLRWTPFEEYPQVNEETYQEVYDLLADSLIPYGILLDRKSTDAVVLGAPQGPMHAGDAVTVDALIKVIMSQATNNENALSAQARLIKAFPYMVDGKTVVGKIPNYHDVRTADFAKLKSALATAGLQNMRAKTIPECLNAIRQKNRDANSSGCSVDSNPPNTIDFVPGSLSLDYLNQLNTQEKLDELVGLPGIGVKTACCILAFNFQLPVFAVDTHVFRMTKWLGWVPEGCNRDDAAAHLDMFIPDNLKYGLHQGFWHHGQKCLRCMAKNDPTTKGWEDAVCVIEQFLKRHPKKERKSPSQKRKRGDDDDDDNDGDDSPKPKAQNGNKTMTSKEMTDEQAAERGYELFEIDVDDNFLAPGANITHKKKIWVKKTV